MKRFQITLLICCIASLTFSQTFNDLPDNEPNGATPQNWDILEGASVISSFQSSTVIQLDNNSIITPSLGSEDYLTDSFTLEFDAYFNEVLKSMTYQVYEIRLWPGLEKVTVPSAAGDGYYAPIEVMRHSIRMDERQGDSNVIKHQATESSLKNKVGTWRSVRLEYNQGKLSVFVNDFELLDISNFNYVPTMISIGTNNKEYDANFNRYIKNISINGIDLDSEETDNGSGSTENENPLNSDYAYNLPKEDGLPNQILQTNGDGIVSWVDDNPNNQFNTNETPNTNAISLNDLVDGKSEVSQKASVFLGIGAGELDDGDNYNIALGHESLASNTSGNNNSAVGFKSLKKNTVGSINTALGALALYNNTIGKNNIAIGGSALFENEYASNNIAIGVNSLGKNTEGNYNISIGHYSSLYNSTGVHNVAVGNEALMKNVAGYNNVALGKITLKNNISGNNNIAIGPEALLSNTQGNGNTAVGRAALRNNKGSYNIGIGQGVKVPNSEGSYQVQIGNNSISYAGIQVAWTVTSDKSWKENIRPLPYGLNILMQLQPVDYIRKNNENKNREMGFIAQEVEEVLKNIGYQDQGFLTKDDEGKLSLRYNDLIALLTKAIQEQQAIIEGQNIKIDELSANLSTNMDVVGQLQKRLNQIEASFKTNQ